MTKGLELLIQQEDVKSEFQKGVIEEIIQLLGHDRLKKLTQTQELENTLRRFI